MTNLKRRSFMGFSVNMASLLLATLLTTNSVLAQNPPPPDGQYRKLETPVATTSAANKIEVIEFFWFGCGHCNALDPALEAWLKKTPADVSFKRIHVNFGERTDIHQRLFLTLEALGLNATQNASVFTEIHAKNKKMTTREEVLAWAQSRNLDMKKFTATFDDRFTMARKQALAAQLQAAYKVDGVPHFGVDGQYITSPGIARSELGFFNTLNYLVQITRKKNNPVTAVTTATTTVKQVIKKPESKVISK
jgi:protein dithiol oxidoreductase (disulfide-forming)